MPDQLQDHLDRDEEDDDPFEDGAMLMAQFFRKDAEELMDNVQALVENLHSREEVEVVRGHSVERF